ncbi:unnamed protein product [Ambrosiozyma monospora]|uniref:Unnamed protein product n=1 Tax=Ambrosiozyma monospora TaxID=43982 RepID=A0ACB5TCU4_AMBMO|nr:unnamed protein product [Ambrosiozyma monospora]
MSDDEKRHGTWVALQEAVDSGKVKSIGVSNYGVKHLKELLAYPDLKYRPVINQIELHPWLARPDLVEYCQKEGIEIEAYSPLAHGQRVNDPKLDYFANKYNKTNAQILIAWSLARGFIVLPKTATESRLLPNLESIDVKLDDEDVKTLNSWDEHLVTGWDPIDYPLDSEKKA